MEAVKKTLLGWSRAGICQVMLAVHKLNKWNAYLLRTSAAAILLEE
jgi:hypothetical protein